MGRVVKFAALSVLVKAVSCTIAGLTYMDALNLARSKPSRGEDPCNPLYWYPRQIPDYCNFPKPEPILIPAKPLPVPTPLPPKNPPPIPLPPADAMPVPLPVYVPMPGPPAVPMPMPIVPAYGPPAPLPMGPGYPPNILPYPIPAIQSGFVPGVDGLVSADGAINVLPFSDAYSDLLEKHKQKMIRRRLQKLLDEYEYYPWKRKCHRKQGCRH